MSHNYYNTGYNSPHSQPSPGGLGYNKQGQPPYSNNPDYQYAQPHQGRQSANSPRFNGQNGSPRGTVTPAYTKGHREQESSGINPAMRGNLPGLKSLNQPDSPHSPLGMGGGASPRGVQSMQQMTRSFRDGEALHSRHHRGTSDFDMRRSECLRQGVLFEDNDFLPEDRSIYYSRNPPFRIEWRRPKDIASQHHMKPEFFVDNASRFDVKQGYMGDCWVVSAIACLSSPDHRELFRRVVPADQGFHEGWYAGIFRFNFWYFGKWVEVIVDDRLPTDRGQLLFVHSSQPNEFWAALLEKAYAKLYGSYEALKSGNISEALTDFTGGICESYILRGPKSNVPRNIVNIMFKALDRQSLIGCGINNPVGKSQETTLENGLVTGHAYSITDLREILLMTDSREMPITLIRIRNPWGTRVEWSGAWGDRSRDWQNIPQGERERMGLVFRDDGEFWMEFQDFLNNFDSLDMCNLTPDSPIDMPKQWHIAEYNSRWQRGFSAGGRANNRDTHWCNPQFRVSLSDIDEDGDDVCSFIIQLMQKDGRRLKQNGKKNLFMGFYIYQIGKNDSLPLKKEFFETNRNVADSKNFIDARQIIRRLVLQPGQYVIVPCTWDRDEIADFYLRFFFENKNMAVVVDEDAGKDDTVAGMVGPVDTDKEDNFKHFFYQVSGEDMEVDAFELQSALNEALRKEPVHRDIGIDACKSFVTLMDVDNTGKLGFTEFLYLWNLLRSWKRLFYQFDMDKSGRLSSFELRRAINAAGFKVSNTVMQHLVFRYADQKLNVSIDGYFICLAKLMKLMNDFNSMKSNDTITLNLNQWLEKGLV